MSKTRRWLVLATVSAGLLMVSVDTTVLYTALPTLTSDLQADASQKLWIINAYPLVTAGLLLGAGTLGDRIGHKRMFLTGLALFAAASLLAAFAPSPPVLIAARAFLAVGAAAMLPATLSLIRITFDDERERGIAIGVWGTMAVLGAALGPIVGGLLLQHFWWGSVFLLNIPVVLLALAATVALVPGGSGHRDRPWDLIASLQAMVALVGLVYAIQEAAKSDPMPLAIVLALLAAAAGGWMFVRRQRHQTYPLIDFSLFRNRSLLTGVIVAALAMAATAGIELLLTQRLQLVLGLTPLHAGLIVTAFAIGSLPVGVLAGGLLHRTGVRPLIGGGLLLGALGGLGTLLLTPGAVPLLGGGRSRAWSWPAWAWASSWSQPRPRSSAAPRRSAASKSCTVAGYSATTGGSPRYCLFTTGKPPTMVRWGTRPVVELAHLIELRTQTVTGPNTWSPSDAHDMLLLCRYLDLGVKAGLVKLTDPPAPHRKAIAAGLPPRGTVFASAVSKAITAVPASLPAPPVDLVAWANGLADRPTGKERNTAARIVRDHMLLLPEWFYGYDDLTEYRHGGLLGEFGWELLPP